MYTESTQSTSERSRGTRMKKIKKRVYINDVYINIRVHYNEMIYLLIYTYNYYYITIYNLIMHTKSVKVCLLTKKILYLWQNIKFNGV